MIVFENTIPVSVGLILDIDEVDLIQRLLQAYSLCPAARDIPTITSLTERLT